MKETRSCSLEMDGASLPEQLPNRRPINTVFQNYALFPHLSVFDNVAFGLKLKKLPHEEISRRVTDALVKVDMGSMIERFPSQLSGGQQQRVALARAFINEPRLLLLDEPLGALDLKMRRHMQVELESLQRRLGMTFLYVTHDQEEAFALSDWSTCGSCTASTSSPTRPPPHEAAPRASNHRGAAEPRDRGAGLSAFLVRRHARQGLQGRTADGGADPPLYRRPDPHCCLEGGARSRRGAEFLPAMARNHLRAALVPAVQPVRHHDRADLQLPAVHGPGAVGIAGDA